MYTPYGVQRLRPRRPWAARLSWILRSSAVPALIALLLAALKPFLFPPAFPVSPPVSHPHYTSPLHPLDLNRTSHSISLAETSLLLIRINLPAIINAPPLFSRATQARAARQIQVEEVVADLERAKEEVSRAIADLRVAARDGEGD